MVMPDVEGKLNAIAGIALPSRDGWTYLNDDCRAVIKAAAAKIRERAREIDRLKRTSGES